MKNKERKIKREITYQSAPRMHREWLQPDRSTPELPHWLFASHYRPIEPLHRMPDQVPIWLQIEHLSAEILCKPHNIPFGWDTSSLQWLPDRSPTRMEMRIPSASSATERIRTRWSTAWRACEMKTEVQWINANQRESVKRHKMKMKNELHTLHFPLPTRTSSEVPSVATPDWVRSLPSSHRNTIVMLCNGDTVQNGIGIMWMCRMKLSVRLWMKCQLLGCY